MVSFIAFFGQMSGNGLFSYWQAPAIKQAGFDDSSTQLVIMGITPVISLIMAQFGARATDKIGRRTLLITGTFVLSAFMVVSMVGSGEFQQINFVCLNPGGASQLIIPGKQP